MDTNTLVITDVTFEHYRSEFTLGVDDERPRISWAYSKAPSDFQQSAYEIEIYEQASQSNDKIQLCLKRIEATESSLVPWPLDQPLVSRQKVFARVRAWDQNGLVSQFSEPAVLETGLLQRSEWVCKRITSPDGDDGTTPQPEKLFRKQFTTQHTVARARLYITAQGVYEVEINGQRVGDEFLAPGWTVYNRRLRYQVYDATAYLAGTGADNCIGIRIAEGWFSGRIGFDARRGIWGSQPAVMAQLEVTYEGNYESQTIGTDESWLYTSGPTTRAEIYDGEKYDARLEISRWSSSSQSSIWKESRVLPDLPEGTQLVHGSCEPTRRVSVVKPVEIIITPAGKTVLDFGQNLVGYTRMKKIRRPRGHILSLYHAEVLEHGELGRRPLRVCDALDQYTFSGSPDGESWEPRFTFHGFRYCQVEGWDDPNADIRKYFEAVVCHTDMTPAGEFSCSDDKLNKLFSNALWSMRGNFLAIPTDCPQRDERLGWTGDIALFVPTATKLFNCFGILKDWLVDVVYDQEARGGIPPLVTPDILTGKDAGWGKIWPCSIWADATILVPWALYQASGDPDILARQYDSMTAYLKNIPRKDALWDPTAFQLGDWLDPSAPPEAPMSGKTDTVLVADAFLVRAFDLLAEIAAIIGKSEDAKSFKESAASARRQFVHKYITPAGLILSDSQTSYALAICFDLIPEGEQAIEAGNRLAYLVRKNNFKIGTGFAGTPFICEALLKAKHAQVAFSMLRNENCPSWLYPITMGATTIWERWDSMLPDGSINPGEMTSFNHYAFGSVVTFLYERLAGLTMLTPGWKKSRFEPFIMGDVDSARATYKTPAGNIECSWKLEGDKLSARVVVPPTSTVEVVLPFATEKLVETVGAGEWVYSGQYAKDGEWPVAPVPLFP